jgi:hypothetical protein
MRNMKNFCLGLSNAPLTDSFLRVLKKYDVKPDERSGRFCAHDSQTEYQSAT